MFAATAQASHPAVASLLGLGTAGLTAAVVAMVWNVHVRQFRLAELLARRQFGVTAGGQPGLPGVPGPAGQNGTGQPVPGAAAHAGPNGRAAGAGPGPAVVIEGPDAVIVGEQARYRVRPADGRTVVSWAVGGGTVSQAPDPAHPDELLLIAGQPGSLMVSVRVREGMTDRRATMPVTAVPDPAPAPPVTLGLFLHGWGLAAAAVLITGLTATLVALGELAPGSFIAVVTPLAALLAVVAATAGRPAATAGRPGTSARSPGATRPEVSGWHSSPAPVQPSPRERVDT